MSSHLSSNKIFKIIKYCESPRLLPWISFLTIFPVKKKIILLLNKNNAAIWQKLTNFYSQVEHFLCHHHHLPCCVHTLPITFEWFLSWRRLTHRRHSLTWKNACENSHEDFMRWSGTRWPNLSLHIPFFPIIKDRHTKNCFLFIKM